MNHSTGTAIRRGGTSTNSRASMMLIGLLVLQLSLAMFLKLSESQYQTVEPTAPLLTCDTTKVDKVIVEENDDDGKSKSRVVFQKDKGSWQLPETFGLRTPTAKVGQLLDLLKDLKKGFPIATTSGATERFKVSPKSFVRAISLYEGQKDPTILYLGSSPSFKTMYAKSSSSNDIYTVDLMPSQINAKSANWVDNSVAEVIPSLIVCLEFESFKVQKAGTTWTMTAHDKTETLPENVALSFGANVSNTPINSVLGTTDKPEYNSGHPELSYKLTLKDGKSVTYRYSKSRDGNQIVLKTSDNNCYFEVDESLLHRLKGFSAESLMVMKSEAEKAKRAQPPVQGEMPDKVKKQSIPDATNKTPIK